MFTTLTALALVDGLHVVAIAALVLLLQQGLRRAALFMAALLATHLVGGIALLVGWNLVSVQPPRWWTVVEWGLVVVLVLAAVVRRPRGIRMPKGAPVAAGVTVSLIDLALDVPYHLAAARITAEVSTVPGQLAWLAWFNVAYVTPMLVAAAVVTVLRRRRDGAAPDRSRSGARPSCQDAGASGGSSMSP